MRMKKSYRNEDYETMKGELRYLLNNAPISKLGIDDTGLGNNLAEDLAKEFSGTCDGITFTNPWKEEVATNIRCLFEAQQLAVPDKRAIINQIHSIKRIVTEHGNLRLDAEKNKDHHGDIFWAIALGCSYIKKAFVTDFSVKMPDEDDPQLCKFPRPKQRVFTPKASPLIRQVRGIGQSFDPRRRQEK
jgi:phage FluMu gp28-like protein